MSTSAELAGVSYGEIIRKYRTYQGLTQKKLGQLADMSPQQIYQYEKSAYEPNAYNLARIARALGVSTSHLLGEVPFMHEWPGRSTQ